MSEEARIQIAGLRRYLGRLEDDGETPTFDLAFRYIDELERLAKDLASISDWAWPTLGPELRSRAQSLSWKQDHANVDAG